MYIHIYLLIDSYFICSKRTLIFQPPFSGSFLFQPPLGSPQTRQHPRLCATSPVGGVFAACSAWRYSSVAAEAVSRTQGFPAGHGAMASTGKLVELRWK